MSGYFLLALFFNRASGRVVIIVGRMLKQCLIFNIALIVQYTSCDVLITEGLPLIAHRMDVSACDPVTHIM